MAEIINLRKARKAKARAEKEAEAAEGKEKLGQHDERGEGDTPEGERQTPFAEDDPDAPRPRR